VWVCVRFALPNFHRGKLHVMSSLNLKRLLRDANMSQFDLSRASGVHPSQISRACSGMELSDDAERRVLEVLSPHDESVRTPLKIVEASDDE
jgi:hypothetical protein